MKPALIGIFLIATLGTPLRAHADDCTKDSSNRVRVNIDATIENIASGKNGQAFGASFTAPLGNQCTAEIGASWKSVDRFGIKDDAFGLQGHWNFNEKGFTNIEIAISPNSELLARSTVFAEIGKPLKFDSGGIDTIVVSAQFLASDYSNLNLAKFSANFEIYPRNKNFWFTTKIGQSLVDGDTLPVGYSGRFDLPFTDTSRGFIFVSNDFEVELGRINEVQTQGIGVNLGLLKGSRISLIYANEDREVLPNRSSFVFGISTLF